MATPGALGLPFLEQFGIGIIQQAANALGSGVLSISDTGSGLTMTLNLPGGQSINVDGLSVAPPGLSGTVSINGLSSANPLTATLFDGFTFGLTAFDVTLANSGLSASQIAGQLTIPFFTDSAGIPKRWTSSWDSSRTARSRQHSRPATLSTRRRPTAWCN